MLFQRHLWSCSDGDQTQGRRQKAGETEVNTDKTNLVSHLSSNFFCINE